MPVYAAASILVAIFLGHIVFCDFAGAYFTLVRVRNIFHTVDHFGLESLPFFEQFFDALGIDVGPRIETLSITGLSGGTRA